MNRSKLQKTLANCLAESSYNINEKITSFDSVVSVNEEKFSIKEVEKLKNSLRNVFPRHERDKNYLS